MTAFSFVVVVVVVVWFDVHVIRMTLVRRWYENSQALARSARHEGRRSR